MKPNILFFMTDQMQGRVLDSEHPCQTPHIDQWTKESTRITRAYTPNAVCSPARASLMTGLLPHNHGVLQVTHNSDEDQNVLRTDRKHWAQSLENAGYYNGYFGKWHIERSNKLESFGWQVNGSLTSEAFQNLKAERMKEYGPERFSLQYDLTEPPGYKPTLLYGTTNLPPQARNMGITTDLAIEFLDEAMGKEEPWCCFVSLTEPHDPFICGQAAYEQMDVDDLKLSPNAFDPLNGRPGLYRKLARISQSMTERQKKEAMACYYASISEIDEQFGRLLQKLKDHGQMESTIVVLTSDHGELLGAHGLYTKNVSAAEEVYHIPMQISGPGIRKGVTSEARVGLHDLCPTLLELVGESTFNDSDSRSFVAVLREPDQENSFQIGFAEYYGGRIYLTQRVVWDNHWKFVFNGFDFDELYDLEQDPGEMENLVEDEDCQEMLHNMYQKMWKKVKETGDHSLYNLDYPGVRAALVGPSSV